LSAAPGASNLQGASIQPANYSQDAYNTYQGQQNQYNQNQAQLWGGALGLGSLGLKALAL
jgi:hypothetical protein